MKTLSKTAVALDPRSRCWLAVLALVASGIVVMLVHSFINAFASPQAAAETPLPPGSAPVRAAETDAGNLAVLPSPMPSRPPDLLHNQNIPPTGQGAPTVDIPAPRLKHQEMVHQQAQYLRVVEPKHKHNGLTEAQIAEMERKGLLAW